MFSLMALLILVACADLGGLPTRGVALGDNFGGTPDDVGS